MDILRDFPKHCKHHDYSHFLVPNRLDGQRLPCQFFGEATRTAVDYCRLHLHCAKAFLKWVTPLPTAAQDGPMLALRSF